MTTRLLHTRAQLRAALGNRSGEVGVVMTMGALHDGHRELIRVARRRCDVIVVTDFLNPLQFAPDEDLSRYPRTLDADLALCSEESVDVLFAPDVAEVYASGEPQVRVLAGPLGDVLEGASRPGHFDGVLTVVAKLLHITRPDVAYFGQKDAQQLLLIRRMVDDLDFPVQVVAVPTVREPSGLALSSRNGYLDEDDRVVAVVLSRSLSAAAAVAADGPVAVLTTAREVLDAQPALGLDYVALVDPITLRDVGPGFAGTALLALAAKVGRTRLIDNAEIELGSADG
ncbi:MAG: pantoate--beta-alanine ligase [Actinomycetota bacterium]|nr:pantoate--beta-alanine ligase [Actinomycetota bacterium]